MYMPMPQDYVLKISKMVNFILCIICHNEKCILTAQWRMEGVGADGGALYGSTFAAAQAKGVVLLAG